MSLVNKQRVQAALIGEMRRLPQHQWFAPPNGAKDVQKRRVTGQFLNIQHLFLRWLPDGWFQYLPHPEPSRRFGFRRYNGEMVVPGLMFTSGSALPPEIVGEGAFDAARMAPALLLHDWLYDQRFSTAASRSFDDALDVLVEGAATLAGNGRGAVTASDVERVALFGGSQIAHHAWNASPGNTLPERTE